MKTCSSVLKHALGTLAFLTSVCAAASSSTTIDCKFSSDKKSFQTARFVMEGKNADSAFNTAAREVYLLSSLATVNGSFGQRVDFHVAYFGVEVGMYQVEGQLQSVSFKNQPLRNYDVQIMHDFWSLEKMTITLRNSSDHNEKPYTGICRELTFAGNLR